MGTSQAAEVWEKGKLAITQISGEWRFGLDHEFLKGGTAAVRELATAYGIPQAQTEEIVTIYQKAEEILKGNPLDTTRDSVGKALSRSEEGGKKDPMDELLDAVNLAISSMGQN